jgi:hypothetical protein
MTDIPAAPADPGIAHPDRGEIARYLLSRVWTRRPGRWFRGGSRWTLVRGTSSSFRLVSARNGNLPTKQFPPERANHLGVGYYTAYGKWTSNSAPSPPGASWPASATKPKTRQLPTLRKGALPKPGPGEPSERRRPGRGGHTAGSDPDDIPADRSAPRTTTFRQRSRSSNK